MAKPVSFTRAAKIAKGTQQRSRAKSFNFGFNVGKENQGASGKSKVTNRGGKGGGS